MKNAKRSSAIAEGPRDILSVFFRESGSFASLIYTELDHLFFEKVFQSRDTNYVVKK